MLQVRASRLLERWVERCCPTPGDQVKRIRPGADPYTTLLEGDSDLTHKVLKDGRCH